MIGLGTLRTRYGLKTDWLHSEVKALQRLHIVRALRTGEIDVTVVPWGCSDAVLVELLDVVVTPAFVLSKVLVGVNLLREGLDLPEVSKVPSSLDRKGWFSLLFSDVQEIALSSGDKKCSHSDPNGCLQVSLVAILDADKEGFLRSDKSLIQVRLESVKAWSAGLETGTCNLCVLLMLSSDDAHAEFGVADDWAGVAACQRNRYPLLRHRHAVDAARDA